MASTTSTVKLTSRLAVTSGLSGDASSAKNVPVNGATAYVDMNGYESVLVRATAAALTGTGITAFSLVAHDAAALNGNSVTIKTHALGTAPDANGDSVVLECTADEINTLGRASGYALRYLAVNITCNNSSDSILTTVIRAGARFEKSGLTADAIA